MKRITFLVLTVFVFLQPRPLEAGPQPTAPAKLTKKARKICNDSGRNPKSIKLLKWPMVDGWQSLCRPHEVGEKRPIYVRCDDDRCWIQQENSRRKDAAVPADCCATPRLAPSKLTAQAKKICARYGNQSVDLVLKWLPKAKRWQSRCDPADPSTLVIRCGSNRHSCKVHQGRGV